MVAGIVVRLPFATAPVCLPVLLRLWAGKGTTTPVELAAQLLKLLVAEFPDRQVHGSGTPPTTASRCWCPGRRGPPGYRPMPACHTAPPRTGRRGRPALKGRKLGRPTALAAAATGAATGAGWRKTAVYRYGRTETVALAERRASGTAASVTGPAGVCCCASSARPTPTTWPCSPSTRPPPRRRSSSGTRSAGRSAGQRRGQAGRTRGWAGPEPGQKRRRATVPFGMLVQSLVVIWYALHGYHPDDALARRLAQPWYQSKTEPSFENMITKLRKTLIVARFTPVSPGQPNPDLLHDYALACAAAAA